MTTSESLPKKSLLLIAAVQGIAILYLKTAHESGYWPSASPLCSFPLWALALAVPVLLLLGLERGNAGELLRPLGVFVALLVAVAVYTGAQARPFDGFPIENLVVVFALSIALACFKALMYVQQRASGVPMSYDVLFTYSWRNFLTLGLALLMTGVFWLILVLWGELFDAIGIDFFKRLFRMDWFVIPVLAIAHGFGIVIFRNLQNVIDGITRLLQGLIKLLLPLVVGVAVIFVVSLPFVGLDALWSTGRGTALLLWLLALVLFFTNAVYQDGRGEKPYPAGLHRALYAGLCVTPFVAALGFYGLWLRVDQYGWTVARAWAILVCVVLTLFAIGYVVGIVRRRDDWTLELARVNTGMGLVVLALMLLVNSPLPDFRKLSLASQLERVDAGETELADFDFWYARHWLARPGHLALEDLRVRAGDDEELLAMIDNPTPRHGTQPRVTASEFWERLHYRPDSFAVPEDLKAHLLLNRMAVTDERRAVLIRVDVDEDGAHEYVLAHLYGGELLTARLYYRQGESWERAQMTFGRASGRLRPAADDILEGEVRLVEPAVRDLAVGDVILRVSAPAGVRLGSPERAAGDREDAREPLNPESADPPD